MSEIGAEAEMPPKEPVHSFTPPRREALRTEIRNVEPVPSGLDGLWHDGIGAWKSRRSRSQRLWQKALELEVLCRESENWHEHEFKAALRTHRARIKRLGDRWKEGVEAAMPCLVEAARRTLHLKAYPTQIMGALAISEGSLVEMATGEGKTLTIALAAAAAGWSGKPCHVITANDYLAQRDAADFSRFYQLCRLKIASVSADMTPPERRETYQADVVYCTGKELVADYLRDQIALGPYSDAHRRAMIYLLGRNYSTPGAVLRGLHTAIVDEVDNQLIDEAATPLIISRHSENEAMKAACIAADRCAAGLLPGEHYSVNEREKEITINEAGRELIGVWCEDKTGLLKAQDWVMDLVQQSLQARHFFLRDKQYVMIDGKVVIVDEYTGRLMPGRSWRLGLHQAVEAKEEAEVSEPSETLARLSFQNFYRYFDHLAGISGTARESWREFWRIYAISLVEVPHYKPNIREDQPLRLFYTEESKWAAVADEIEQQNRLGRPVLVGTRSVDASERLGRLLNGRGMFFTILNAVRHEQEAEVVHRAGDLQTITIATNMAGRGTDIRLGQGVANRGGLHVILTEGHESARIDRQLKGRAARQGSPGSSVIFAAYSDELIQRFLGPVRKRLLDFWLSKRLPGAFKFMRLGFKIAQRKAERKGRRQRFLLLKQDQEISKNLIGAKAKSSVRD
jgi:preprotein translocase subunit SecA